jgi:hypothetical protein
MMKHLIAAVIAASVCVSEAASQTLLQRSDRGDRKFETYLPRVNATVPWLELDTKTRLPKGDIPVGRGVASSNPFAMPSGGADIQLSTNVNPAFGSM